ncbi:alkaline phosphatase PhoX [Micromonospora inyonensis]|uniref:alkaline phosphatase PhoX n=1 Tax=Micromonospora inyonensis TaxID=47866 RepID=UPI000A866939|nr:alkaline phosphatase PhoX [Micromonospora inyonensis]
MSDVNRRGLLRGAAVVAGGAVLGGPFLGFVARDAAGAAGRRPRPRPALEPVADLRDGKVRLWLPDGFQYRSFHDTESPVTLDDGTVLPGRHDGMGAFPGPGGTVRLVRNHEINGPVPAFGDAAEAYDPMARAAPPPSR